MGEPRQEKDPLFLVEITGLFVDAELASINQMPISKQAGI